MTTIPFVVRRVKSVKRSTGARYATLNRCASLTGDKVAVLLEITCTISDFKRAIRTTARISARDSSIRLPEQIRSRQESVFQFVSSAHPVGLGASCWPCRRFQGGRGEGVQAAPVTLLVAPPAGWPRTLLGGMASYQAAWRAGGIDRDGRKEARPALPFP